MDSNNLCKQFTAILWDLKAGGYYPMRTYKRNDFILAFSDEGETEAGFLFRLASEQEHLGFPGLHFSMRHQSVLIALDENFAPDTTGMAVVHGCEPIDPSSR